MATLDIHPVKKRKLTPPRPRADWRSSKKRREELLFLGVRAFAEKGIGNAVHADLAAAAGVSTPTVFHYFSTRKSLIEAILNEVGRFMRDRIFVLVKNAKSPEAALLDSGLAIAELAGSHPEYTKVWLMWGSFYDPEYRSAYHKIEHRFLDTITKILRAFPDAETDKKLVRDRARLIMGAGHMLMQMAIDNPDPDRIELYVRHVMATLLAPIKGTSP